MTMFLFVFIGLSIVNVVFSTIRSITTIKSGKMVASFVSGGYFAFYNIMLIYTVADFPMWEKCLITFICNVVGVWIVKLIEEKMRKDKLWKIEMCVKIENKFDIINALDKADISYNYISNLGNYVLFNCYANTQTESEQITKIGKKYNAKFFASETKFL